MRKREHVLNASLIISGLGAGEHQDAVQEMKEIIAQFGKSQVDMISVRLRAQEYPEEMFYDVARTAKENQIYFAFLYAYQFPPKGKESHLTKEIIKNVKEIAGEYFLGEIFGEAGSDKAAKAKGYFKKDPDCLATVMPPQDFENFTQAKQFYIDFVKKMVEYDQQIGIDSTMLVEATAFSKYNLEAGVDTPCLEVMPGNPEHLISFTRGAARGYNREKWGGFIANEWYGGYRHEDAIKEKRLRLAYNYLYLTGANIVYLESGYSGIQSFGYDLPASSKESAFYRQTVKEFHEFLEKDKRPSCGPVTKVAFLHGNLDAYTGFMGSSLWSQFDKKEWGMSASEYSWRILNEVFRSDDWHDFTNFGQGGEDFSAMPAYGQYDVLPVESEVDVWKKYDLLIFAGWNTMTAEIYEKMKAYVADGGNLILTAAHLNTQDKRGEEAQFIHGGYYADFLGFDVVGISSTNDGVKFCRDGLAEGVQYPGTNDFICDCNFCRGYAEYVNVKVKGGVVKAFFEDKFAPAPENMDEVRPALIENRYGKGIVSCLTYFDYPGAEAVYTVYKAVVKNHLTATHRSCDLQVLGSDKVRVALYHDEAGNEKLYLLNTDFNVAQNVRVKYKGQEREFSIPSTELIWWNFGGEA